MIGIILPFCKKQEKPDREGNRDRFFKGQQFNEELRCFFRKHWITILHIFGIAILLIIVEAFVLLGFSQFSAVIKESLLFSMIYVAIVIGFTIYVHKIFLKLFAHFMDIYIFTNSRIVDHRKTVILHDSEEMLDIMKIQDIQMFQNGLLQNLLGYGEIVVTLSSSKASRKISYVPNVNFHYRCLTRIKREAALIYENSRGRNGSLELSYLANKASEIEKAVSNVVNSTDGR